MSNTAEAIHSRLPKQFDLDESANLKMAAIEKNNKAAQNQHYVPKFFLRNFSCNSLKDQVNVFSKSKAKGFTTSIKNILAERQFYAFQIDEQYKANFEQALCRVEDSVFPSYREVVQRRSLGGSLDEKIALARLIAFQLLRTRSQRNQFIDLHKQLTLRANRDGVALESLEGWGLFTENGFAHLHVNFIRNSTDEVTKIISGMNFLLLKAPMGRAFYLSDNPVNIHNSEPQYGRYGKMGLACKGIEIYLPLSSNLMLCAWCPTIIQKMRERLATASRNFSSTILSPAMTVSSRFVELQMRMEKLNELNNSIVLTLRCIENGIPVAANSDNMDFQNSLQVAQANEHVICQQADFAIARRFVNDFPGNHGVCVAVN